MLLSTASYKTPHNPRTWEKPPESSIFNECILLTSKRIMAALLWKTSFKQKAIIEEISTSVDRIIQICIRNALTRERKIYETYSKEWFFKDYMYRQHCPLLASLFPDKHSIAEINIWDIDIPSDLIDAIRLDIISHFQSDDSLERLESIKPYLNEYHIRSSQRAIVLTRALEHNYWAWESWIQEEMNNPNWIILWEEMDKLFFTAAFPVRAQQSLEAIYTSRALIAVLDSYIDTDHDTETRAFIQLLQWYFKKQVILSALSSTDMDNSPYKERYEITQAEQQDTINSIQSAIQNPAYQDLLNIFIQNIHSIDNLVNFMNRSYRLWIQSTKEHWVWSYGISTLIRLGA